MRLLMTAAAFLLAAAPALAFDVKAMSEDERSAFRAEIRAYLLDNPEVIMEAVEMFEQRQAAQQAAQDIALVKVNAEDLFNDGHSWVGGNPEGDITLVEFVDYRCGYCRRAHDEVADLINGDDGIRFILKEFPILGEASVLSSRFAIAVHQLEGGDAYKRVGDALIKYKGDVSVVALRRLAATMGLDADAILERMDSDAVTDVIRQNRLLAQRLNISGTPTFVLEDQMLRGYLPYETMVALVAEKRAE